MVRSRDEGTLLVSFGNFPGSRSAAASRLRLQTRDADEAAGIEAVLSSEVPEGTSWERRRTPDGACFLVHGDAGTLRRLFDAPGGPAEPLRCRLRAAAAAAFENRERRRFTLDLPRGRRWELGRRPAILGILNVTPDSFSDGGRHAGAEAAVRWGVEMLEQGADAIDVGGESTRPGAAPVPAEEEIRRVAPVVAGLRRLTEAPISVDTYKAEVARAALEEGADIVNDVTALEEDPGMAALLRGRPVPVVLMHMKGRPPAMQENPRYDDATAEVFRYLAERLQYAEEQGIAADRAIVDPGIGFGKRSVDNLTLLREVSEFSSLGRPVLIGVSRKSFLGKLLGRSVEEREAGTLVANTIACLGGVSVIRTHHIPNAREMAALLEALAGSPQDRDGRPDGFPG